MKKFAVWAFNSLMVLNLSIAQGSSQNQLSGIITVDGNPVSNAVVTLYFLNKSQSGYDRTISSKTSDSGYYKIEIIPNGTYVFIVTKEGQRLYQGKVATSGQNDSVKNIELTAFIYTGKWKLNLQKSKIPETYRIIDATRTYSKKGDLITVLWSQTYKNGDKTTGKYQFKCDGKKWVSGGQTISCNYKYYGSNTVVEGEKSPPHEYFRNEVKNNALIICTYKDSKYKQLISMSVFDPGN